MSDTITTDIFLFYLIDWLLNNNDANDIIFPSFENILFSLVKFKMIIYYLPLLISVLFVIINADGNKDKNSAISMNIKI
jgi:hypothetical protein